TQNVLMILKIAAILTIVAAGLALVHPHAAGALPPAASTTGAAPVAGVGAAMVPVLFAYGGWQTAAFVGGGGRGTAPHLPPRPLPGGMGRVGRGVAALSRGGSGGCLRVLGAAGVAARPAPAAALMRAAFGETGARVLAFGVAASTLGFLSQSMLTAPRVYYAMAADGLFFRGIARVNPRTRVPVRAVVLQGVAATVIALTGEYGRILDTVIPADWIFFGLSAACVFAFRRGAAPGPGGRPGAAAIPFHPLTTLAFIAVSGWIVVQSLLHD